jgi:hypothetical protein
VTAPAAPRDARRAGRRRAPARSAARGTSGGVGKRVGEILQVERLRQAPHLGPMQELACPAARTP